MTTTTDCTVKAPSPSPEPPKRFDWMALTLGLAAVVAMLALAAAMSGGSPAHLSDIDRDNAAQAPSLSSPALIAAAAARLPKPAPSPDRYQLPKPQGTTPITESSPGVGLTWDPTPQGAVTNPCTWQPTVGQLVPADQTRLLAAYKTPAAKVVEWNLLVPTFLDGSPTDPRNVWPMTSTADTAGKHQLERWIAAAMCHGTDLAGGPVDAPRAHSIVKEYWHWWDGGLQNVDGHMVHSWTDPESDWFWNPGNAR